MLRHNAVNADVRRRSHFELGLPVFKQRDVGQISVGFQGRWTRLLFFRFTDFLRSSRYFSSIVISINFYHVECGDGRQPRILVDNFWIPRSKTCTCSSPGPGFTQTWQSRVITFFRINKSHASEATTSAIGPESVRTPQCSLQWIITLILLHQMLSFEIMWNLDDYCKLILKSVRLRPLL